MTSYQRRPLAKWLSDEPCAREHNGLYSYVSFEYPCGSLRSCTCLQKGREGTLTWWYSLIPGQPMRRKKVSFSLCINLQVTLRLTRGIPSANCIYAGFNTIQLASAAQQIGATPASLAVHSGTLYYEYHKKENPRLVRVGVNGFSWSLWADASGLGQGSREVYKSHMALETWYKVSSLISHRSTLADYSWGSVNFYSESNHAVLYGERQQSVNHHIIPIVLISLNLWDADQFYFTFTSMGIRNSLYLSALHSVRTF